MTMMQTAITEALVGAVRDLFTIVALAAVVFYRNTELGFLAIKTSSMATRLGRCISITSAIP